MHFSTAVALLPLLLTLTSTSAAHVNPHGGRDHPARRHPVAKAAGHSAQNDLERVRREATIAMEKKEGIVGRSPLTKPKARSNSPLAGGKKGKRLVRKKRSTSGCQQTFGTNSTIPQVIAVGGNATTNSTATSYLNATANSTATGYLNASLQATNPATSYYPNATASIINSQSSYYPNSTASVTDSSSPSQSASQSTLGDAAFAQGTATTTSKHGFNTGSTTTNSSSWSSTSSTTYSQATAGSTTTASTTTSAGTSTSTSAWTLIETISGSNFFDSSYWYFWDYSDPTHGTVNYVDSTTAWNDGLVSINSAGHAIMKVDTTETVSTARNSVRIHNNLIWTGGMVIMDAYHIPTGCGTWPAWWQNGPNWPQGGEIDIVEGINEFTQNQVSLHTGVGCTMPSNLNDNQLGTLTTGSYNSYDCSSADTSNQGCGVRDETSDNSFGSAFNSINGGVYALVWDQSGIAVYFFPRSSIPSDITNDSPNPDGWGTPVANFPNTDCSPFEYFYDHFNIFDTTLCGDWAGADSVWNYAGYAGQSQSCAALTGYSTCSDFVLNSGSSFSDAYWEVSYVKYFNSTTLV